MIKKLFPIVLFFFTSCKKEISIVSVENKVNSWKVSNGFLIIKKSNKCDTIFDCSYGRAPDYKLVRDNNREYLFTTCEINGGGNNIKTFFLRSLDNDTFLDTIYFKEIYISEEYKKNDSTYIFIKRLPEFELKNNLIQITVDSTTENFNNNGKFKLISKGKITYKKSIKN